MKKIWIIIFLGLLIYSPSLFNGFVWDDEVIFQNAGSIPGTIYFRPVISAVYWTIYNVFGSRPFFFHFFQLAFHIGTAVLIYYLFRRFFKKTISFILAIIFLVHPVSVEAISFASAMQEVTFTLTGIAGLYLFVRRDVINHVSTHVFFATFLLLIALLMKETAIVFFVLVFCYLVLFKRKQADVLVSYSIFAVIFLMAYLLFRLSGGSLYVQGQGLFPIMRVSLATRLINIPMIILYYLSKFFYPFNLAIAQHWVVRTISFNNFILPLILEVLLFLSAVIYIIKSKNKVFIFFFLWFILGLLPHLQIIPLNMTVAERWLYFPMVGLLGMIGALLSSPRKRGSNASELIQKSNFSLDSLLRGNDKFILLFSVFIISIFSVRSFVRVLDWRNGLTLFSRDIRQDSSFDLQNNMGVELFRIGRYTEAKKYFEISTQLAPYWWVNWNNLGAIYEQEKDYQKAMEYYQKSVNNGQYYLAYENLAKILILHGKDQKKTEEFLKETLRLFPKNETLWKISNFYNQQLNQKQIK